MLDRQQQDQAEMSVKRKNRARRKIDSDKNMECIGKHLGPRGTAMLVAEKIRDAIVSGGIGPGTWLRETLLAVRFGVSRIPVREALARLESEGLVERVPYRGTRVVLLTLHQVIESFMLRSLLEGFAVKLAAPNMTGEDIARIKDLIEKLEECGREGRYEDTPPLHWEIHSAICNRCGSEKLLQWIHELDNRFPRSLKQSHRFGDQPEEYRRIVKAIEEGDAERAGSLMSEHIEIGAKVHIQHYAEKLSE